MIYNDFAIPTDLIKKGCFVHLPTCCQRADSSPMKRNVSRYVGLLRQIRWEGKERKRKGKLAKWSGKGLQKSRILWIFPEFCRIFQFQLTFCLAT